MCISQRQEIEREESSDCVERRSSSGKVLERLGRNRQVCGIAKRRCTERKGFRIERRGFLISRVDEG